MRLLLGTPTLSEIEGEIEGEEVRVAQSATNDSLLFHTKQTPLAGVRIEPANSQPHLPAAEAKGDIAEVEQVLRAAVAYREQFLTADHPASLEAKARLKTCLERPRSSARS